MPSPPHHKSKPEVTELSITSNLEVVEVIRRDGGVIIKGFVSPEIIARVDRQAAPKGGKKQYTRAISSRQKTPTQ
jgi:hypothetical protein